MGSDPIFRIANEALARLFQLGDQPLHHFGGGEDVVHQSGGLAGFDLAPFDVAVERRLLEAGGLEQGLELFLRGARFLRGLVLGRKGVLQLADRQARRAPTSVESSTSAASTARL